MTGAAEPQMTAISSPPHVARKGVAGITAMMLAMAIVPLIDVQAKLLMEAGQSPLQTVFLRMLCGVALLMPVMVLRHRDEIIPPQGWPPALALGGLSLLGGLMFFGALRFIPIADTVAISFVQPLFVVLLSRLLLKERVGPGRWLALAVGFGATLLIVRPGYGGFNPGTLLALGAGLAGAGYAICIRATTTGRKRVSAMTLTFQTHLVACVVALPLVLPAWQVVSGPQWQLVLGMTLVGLAGQFLVIKAYELSEASLVAPFAYLEIVTATIISWWFFRDMPDGITFLGVAILVASSLALMRRHRSR